MKVVFRQEKADIAAGMRGEAAGRALRMVVQFCDDFLNSFPGRGGNMGFPVQNERDRRNRQARLSRNIPDGGATR
jgi:hypothetical protein